MRRLLVIAVLALGLLLAAGLPARSDPLAPRPASFVAVPNGAPSPIGPSLDAPLRWVVAVRAADVARWNEAVADGWRVAARALAARQSHPAARSAPSTPRRPVPPTASSGRCGGDLPPCWVMMRESGGNIHAYNPTGCGGAGCNGKWQCDPRSCNGTGSEAEQDASAAALWDGGRGCANWNAC